MTMRISWPIDSPPFLVLSPSCARICIRQTLPSLTASAVLGDCCVVVGRHFASAFSCDPFQSYSGSQWLDMTVWSASRFHDYLIAIRKWVLLDALLVVKHVSSVPGFEQLHQTNPSLCSVMKALSGSC